MNLITTNPKLKTQEVNRFVNSIANLQGIFTQERTLKVTDNIIENVETVEINTEDKFIEGGFYGEVELVNNKFKVRYGAAADEMSSEMIPTHELVHVLLTTNQLNMKSKGNVVSSQGPTKYDRVSQSFYGIALTEGLCNIFTKLGIIKKKYAQNIDDYMKNGGYSFLFDYYGPFEDIARLMIIASKNEYGNSRDFGSLITGGHGIDLIVDPEIKMPYSTFINSSLDNDFNMEGEFDYFLGNGNYREMNEVLDLEKEKINIGKATTYPDYDWDILDKQIIKIESYYFNKLEHLVATKQINGVEQRDYLYNEFKVIADKVRENIGITQKVTL